MTTRTKLAWVAALYFAEGFPFGLLVDAFPVYFRLQGLSLAQIGLLSTLTLPWTLKWLWAPLVDLYGRYRTWIAWCQGLLALGLLWLVVMPAHSAPVLWALLVLLAAVAATQDIAIDAYTITLLRKDELGPGNGVRVTAYRIALIVSGGLLVAAAGLLGWSWAFLGAAAVLGAGAWLAARSPDLPRPRPAAAAAGDRVRDAVVMPFRQLLARPGFVWIVLFVLLFKLGDMALGPMIKPFWVDRAFTPVQIGMIPGTVGVISTIAGALLGGTLTKRWGVFHALWILGLLQAGSNLVYAGAAAAAPSAAMMYLASVVESFCGGLGTAPFLAFLMGLCTPAHAATQYALLSALFGLTRVIAGACSGLATEQLGYTSYFSLTFLLALPAFALLPIVKRWTAEAEELALTAEAEAEQTS